MPSAPNANSPFMDSRLQAALGVRAPGTPTSAGKPGVQAADVSFPAPPAPASAPPGRPAAPQAPAPAATVPAAPTPQAAPGADPAATAQLGQPGAAAPALNPDVAYREAVLRGRDTLGPIPRVFRHAALPELPFEPGGFNYNPFTGAFERDGGGMV